MNGDLLLWTKCKLLRFPKRVLRMDKANKLLRFPKRVSIMNKTSTHRTSQLSMNGDLLLWTKCKLLRFPKRVLRMEKANKLLRYQKRVLRMDKADKLMRFPKRVSIMNKTSTDRTSRLSMNGDLLLWNQM